MAAHWPVLLLLAFACLSMVLADVVVTGNPHVPPASAACPGAAAAVSANCARALFISPDSIIPAPAPLQADTFSHVQYVRYLYSVVPVFASCAPPRPILPSHAAPRRYHFRQPERLSHLQLPFRIVLVTAVSGAGISEVPVPAVPAADSWFVGYSWSLLLCACADASDCTSDVHLGWRYTSANGDVFDALIVKYDDDTAAAASVSALPVVAPSSLRVGVPRSTPYLPF